MDRLLTFFGVERGLKDLPPDVDAWPQGLASFIRLVPDGQEPARPALVADIGHFGLVPAFAAAEANFGRRTYNARSETVHSKPSFRSAWKNGKRCIVPAEWIYEPCYETGAAVRWRIHLPNSIPMGIAGVYEDWTDKDGVVHFSFAMLTVNAEGHPLMSRMHAPTDEKRMVVILDPSEYVPWLTSSVADAPGYFRQWTGPLEGRPDPLPPRSVKRKPMPPQSPPEPEPPTTGDLFE